MHSGGTDPLAELDALLDVGRRAPGSDAERRAALHLRDRLSALGRAAELEPVAIHPNWPLAYAALAAASVAASVLAVYTPIAGATLALAAALLLFLDAGMLVPAVRRALGRRASQNVVSWGGDDKPGALVLVAHVDAPRGGLLRTESAARRRAALGAFLRRPIGGLALLFWAQLAVLACCLLRLTGIDATALTAVQFVPTLALIVAVALLVDIALARTRGGENDNGSGCVVVLRLAQRLAATPPAHFDVHVLLTGAAHAGCAGMRAFLRRHRERLDPAGTVVLSVDEVGAGELRYTRREGALLAVRSHPQLVGLCEDLDVEPLVSRSAGDASVAGSAGYAAITITARERGDHAPARVEAEALERAEALCAELVDLLDAEVGPSLAAPAEATALSEP